MKIGVAAATFDLPEIGIAPSIEQIAIFCRRCVAILSHAMIAAAVSSSGRWPVH